MADMTQEIKKLLKEEKLVIGKDSVLKHLRQGKAETLYTAENCPQELKEELEHLAGIAGIEVKDSGLQNTELGDVCKKPFSIAVIAVAKR